MKVRITATVTLTYVKELDVSKDEYEGLLLDAKQFRKTDFCGASDFGLEREDISHWFLEDVLIDRVEEDTPAATGATA